ncbi:hypothetical protein PHMEG_00026063 [Phytophthora megakarya]|uniref:Uncharacterized protein n=1 Tax=Phytophthora megakarya TaxID=4795 RepID=A0A225VBY0_9STRA|nr:hypothetical protein PHMEG_00026063 [Phytophthora megakarya]
MTGTAQVGSSLHIPPTPIGSPGAAAKKILQTRRASQQRSRFSFSKLRRVVVPPVQIPAELNAPNAISNIVAGSKIPMTKAMWMRHRSRLMRRLPGRIDERVAW